MIISTGAAMLLPDKVVIVKFEKLLPAYSSELALADVAMVDVAVGRKATTLPVNIADALFPI